MKYDMRVTMPLWQMGAIFILIILTSLLGPTPIIFLFSEGRFEFEMVVDGCGNWGGLVFLLSLITLIIYLILFTLNIRKHNKRFPNQKMRVFTLKPQEYLEDDELFDEMTKRATKKVYSYYTWALPLFVGLSLGGSWSRTVILIGVLVIALGQYWIYYSTMRKVFKNEDDEF